MKQTVVYVPVAEVTRIARRSPRKLPTSRQLLSSKFCGSLS